MWALAFATAMGLTLRYTLELISFTTSDPKRPVHQGTIFVGAFDWSGYYPLVIAEKLGYFSELGLDVQTVKSNSIAELNDSIRTGRVQVSPGTLADFIILKSLATPIRLVALTDESLTDVILASPSIRSPKELEGKRVGLTEFNSFAEYFLSKSLEAAGVDTHTISYYRIPTADVPNAILRGEIDAGHAWDPYLSEGIQRGLKPILTSGEFPNLVLSGLVFREEIMGLPDVPVKIFHAYLKALELRSTDPKLFAKVAAEYFDHTPEMALHFIETNARIIDLAENVQTFKKDGSLRRNMKSITDFFATRGLPDFANEIEPLIDASILNSVAKQDSEK